MKGFVLYLGTNRTKEVQANKQKNSGPQRGRALKMKGQDQVNLRKCFGVLNSESNRKPQRPN